MESINFIQCMKCEDIIPVRRPTANGAGLGLTDECKNCKLEKEIGKLKGENEKLSTELADLKSLVANLVPDITQDVEESDPIPEDSVLDGSASFTPVTRRKKSKKQPKLMTTETCANTIARELADRERRKQNVVMFNIPEPETSSELSKTSDRDSVKEVFEKIGSDCTFRECFRLGRKSENRMRPILVRFDSCLQRDKTLALARFCRDIRFAPSSKHVGISPDRTPAERNERADWRKTSILRKNQAKNQECHSPGNPNLTSATPNMV